MIFVMGKIPSKDCWSRISLVARIFSIKFGSCSHVGPDTCRQCTVRGSTNVLVDSVPNLKYRT